MLTGRGAWFWFPEQRTGLIYLHGAARDNSYVARTGSPAGVDWIVQLVRPGSRAVCYDVSDAGAPARFALAASDERWQLDPMLAPSPGEAPGVLALAPDEWDFATLAWLTANGDGDPLRV